MTKAGSRFGRLIRHALSPILGTPPFMLGKPWISDAARLVGVVILAALSAWISISSAFLWEVAHYPGAHGVFALVAAGAPIWLLAVPICAALTIVSLLLPTPGKFALALVFGVATFVMVPVAVAFLQGKGGHDISLAVGLTIPAVLLLIICALPLGMTDIVPPDRRLAAVARRISVRQTQFFTLYRWGQELHWQVRAVSGRAIGVELRGKPIPLVPDLEATVRCLSISAHQAPRLSMQLAWPQHMPWFYIGTRPPRVAPPPGTMVIRWRGAFGRTVSCYLAPDQNGRIPSNQQVEALRAQVARNNFVYLGTTTLRRTSTGLMYAVRPWMVFPVYPDMTMLPWLEKVARILSEPAQGTYTV